MSKLDSELDPISISGDTLDDNQANLDVKELWSSMIDVLQSSSEEALGFSKRKNPDWFNESAEEILPLLASKKAAFQAHLAHPTSAVLLLKWKKSCSITQRRLREIQNDWWTHKA